MLTFHLGDTIDWYAFETPQALQGFSGAEAAALFREMIEVQELLPVNERLEPSGDLLPFSLFAASDVDPDAGISLVPVEEFSGVPDFYLLRVTNDEPDAARQYRLSFTDALGQVVDVPSDSADLDLGSGAIDEQPVAVRLGDLDGDGLDEFLFRVKDSLGSPNQQPTPGLHDAGGVDPSLAFIRFSGSGDTRTLVLPAPLLQDSLFGSRAVVSTPGDWNGDGIGDLAVAISLQQDPELASTGFYPDEVFR